MLRQLARLTRAVESAPGALALAVYADAAGCALPAADRGYEGVACVDDAARGLSVLTELWSATRDPLVRGWADGLLAFVLSMQAGDGRFVNFIEDWSGKRNDDGPTSFPGGTFWQARALRGLANAWVVFGDERAADGVIRGLTSLRCDPVPASIRAIHIRTAVELLRAGRLPELARDLGPWCDELLGCRSDGILFDDPDQREPHLWAHAQEAALADAGTYLGRPDLIEAARESAVRFLAPIIESDFALATVQPDGVASAIEGVERVAAATGDRHLAALTDRARGWFDRSDRRGRPVYDRVAGRIGDGMDEGILNEHSGAESNVAGASALMAELPAMARAHRGTIQRLLSPLLA